MKIPRYELPKNWTNGLEQEPGYPAHTDAVRTVIAPTENTTSWHE